MCGVLRTFGGRHVGEWLRHSSGGHVEIMCLCVWCVCGDSFPSFMCVMFVLAGCLLLCVVCFGPAECGVSENGLDARVGGGHGAQVLLDLTAQRPAIAIN